MGAVGQASAGWPLRRSAHPDEELAEVLTISIKHTLPSLLSDPGVVGVFRELRRAGWKDWHLLNVVANLTINHRLTLRHGAITAGRERQMADAFRTEALR